MSKAQSWVVLVMLLLALLNIAGSQSAKSLLKQGHPVQAIKAVNPGLLAIWVVGAIALVVLADYAPAVAGWIAGLLLVGAVLVKGPAGLKNILPAGLVK